MNVRAISLSALLAMAFVITSQAHAEELWGSLTWTKNHYKAHIMSDPISRLPEQYFTGMSWNFRSPKDAFIAARNECRKELGIIKQS